MSKCKLSVITEIYFLPIPNKKKSKKLGKGTGCIFTTDKDGIIHIIKEDFSNVIIESKD